MATEGEQIKGREGNLLAGCAGGCLCQLALLALAAIISQTWRPAVSTDRFVFAMWGIGQWIGIVPLIIHERRSGRSQTALGLILSGAVGTLICSACASGTR